MLFTINLILTNRFGKGMLSTELSFCMRVPHFAIYATVQVLTSKDIRTKIFQRRWNFPLKFFRTMWIILPCRPTILSLKLSYQFWWFLESCVRGKTGTTNFGRGGDFLRLTYRVTNFLKNRATGSGVGGLIGLASVLLLMFRENLLDQFSTPWTLLSIAFNREVSE